MGKKRGKWRPAEKLTLHPNHGWRSKPGYKIFVANRGDVRFDIPRAWVIGQGTNGSITFRDKVEPDDDCLLELSVFSHPPGDFTDLPLVDMLLDGLSADDSDVLGRGEPHHEKRPGAEIAWLESRFVDKGERREARARTCFARCPTSHALLTMSFWPEHAERFVPVWDEVLRSMQLGVYIRDPRLGE